MKHTLLLIGAVSIATGLTAAEPKESLIEAANALANKANYSWKTTVESAGEPPGIIEGKTEKGGASFLTLSRRENSFDAALKGSKATVKTEEGWKPATEAADMEGTRGGTRLVSLIVQNMKLPAAEVADLAGKVKELSVADGVYSGNLGEEAKPIILFRIPSTNDGPSAAHTEGTARFWMKDGMITKYEFHVKGTVSFRGDERELDRTYTTVINGVGETTVNVPEEAAKRL